MRYIALFLVLLLSAGVNLGEQVLDVFGIHQDTLMLALVAIAIAGLLANQHIMVVVLIICLSFAVNLPPEILETFHLNREILLVTLLSTVAVAVAGKLLGIELNTRTARIS